MLAVLPVLWLAVATTVEAAPQAKELTTADLVEKAKPAVVVIHTSSRNGSGTGTGFIVDGTGTIVTNFHVIRDATAVSVKLVSGRVFDEVRVRAFDEARDLAILQVAGSGLPTLPLGEDEPPKQGSRVVIIGNPLGVLEWSVSSGVVSAVRTLETGMTLIQMDAAANPGNSGGPLLNERGQVTGVVTLKMLRAEGLTFAVPVRYVRLLLASKGEGVSLEQFGQQSKGAEPEGDKGSPTARCRDGTFSYSQHRSGTCSGHSGVAEWSTGRSTEGRQPSGLPS